MSPVSRSISIPAESGEERGARPRAGDRLVSRRHSRTEGHAPESAGRCLQHTTRLFPRRCQCLRSVVDWLSFGFVLETACLSWVAPPIPLLPPSSLAIAIAHPILSVFELTSAIFTQGFPPIL